MKPYCSFACVLLLAGSALAQSQGIKPRANADAFPASAQTELLVIGTAQLSAAQVGHAFASPELSKGYIVVEIAVYPKQGEFELDPADFTLRIENSKTVVHAASAQTASAGAAKPGGRDVTLYPVATIGYESGRDIYGQRQSGVTTGAGIGVGLDPKQPRSDGDRRVMETELKDKSLPSGKFEKPVAGYLYFPLSGAKKVKYILEYRDAHGSATLALPEPGK
jgi:hypothetical protein